MVVVVVAFVVGAADMVEMGWGGELGKGSVWGGGESCGCCYGG